MPSERFPSLPWDQVIDRVAKCVFSIEAGDSAGSAFLVTLGRNEQAGTFHAMLATAWHVLADLKQGEGTLQLKSWGRGRTYSDNSHRMGFMRLGPEVFDTGVVYVEDREPVVEIADLLPLFPSDSVLARGSSIGWLGFPAIAEPELCFFKGTISGYLNDPPTYLADGVAINGVSGGPVFDDRCHLIGLVSAYIPNRVDGNIVLPGLAAVTPINAIRYWLDRNVGARDLSKAV